MNLEVAPIFSMVQVDIFWAYAFGAGLALAACRQLVKRSTRNDGDDGGLFDNPYLLKTVLYLSLLFAPSGVYLLWEFPSWETMHVADRSMPALLVAAFAITNVTQGILGFWVVERLLAWGRGYLAYLQVIAGYFFMFFILVHGWDGSGYKRFLSATKDDFLNWDNGNITEWLSSDVALTLLVMGAVLLPVMFWMQYRWFATGLTAADAEVRQGSIGALGFVVVMLLSGVVLPLIMAIAASLLVHLLGWVIGLAAFAAVAWLVVLRRGGLACRLYGLLGLDRSIGLRQGRRS